MKCQGDGAQKGLEKHQKGGMLKAWAPFLEAQAQKRIAHRPGALSVLGLVSLARAAQAHTLPLSKGGFGCGSFHPLLLGFCYLMLFHYSSSFTMSMGGGKDIVGCNFFQWCSEEGIEEGNVLNVEERSRSGRNEQVGRSLMMMEQSVMKMEEPDVEKMKIACLEKSVVMLEKWLETPVPQPKHIQTSSAIKWKRTLELLFFDIMKKFHNIVSGDDCVSISGWDEYGIKFAKDIFVKGMNLTTMKYVFWMTGAYKSHPDPNYDPKALPNITGINYRDVVATQVKMSATLQGISNNPFTNICISNVTIQFNEKPKKHQWNCTDVSRVTNNVTPPPCESLPEKVQSEANRGDENGGSEKHYPNQKPKTKNADPFRHPPVEKQNQKPKIKNADPAPNRHHAAAASSPLRHRSRHRSTIVALSLHRRGLCRRTVAGSRRTVVGSRRTVTSFLFFMAMCTVLRYAVGSYSGFHL
ncbi:hypothetical protein LR48_Vigan07g096000 [Vigna angularis]|uniref:Uncharacterized protein n=1 Tax=Phaseolus angularis TaxID=3914 RepID=A0A0L9UX00_PHAAN|nr:hypothetical protein LR48_Vigan07g096000 [Vigna angularis]